MNSILENEDQHFWEKTTSLWCLLTFGKLLLDLIYIKSTHCKVYSLLTGFHAELQKFIWHENKTIFQITTHKNSFCV